MNMPSVSTCCRTGLVGCMLAGLLILRGSGEEAKIDLLLIGSSGTTKDKAARQKEQSSRETLQRFIKDETGLDNKITLQDNWLVLAEKLAKAKLHLGVFEGYEFAWAQGKHPGLKPLALAINGYRYPVACLMVAGKSKSAEFADLEGKSLWLPVAAPHHLRLYVERQSEGKGKKANGFFSSITSEGTVEDALDDVVDGMLDVAAADQGALDAYKRRKPSRFKRLKEIARSQPFPPAVVAYCDGMLEEAVRRRILGGLLNANRKEKGKMLLTLFRMTGFEKPPEDFAQKLQAVRKSYPAPRPAAK
jgi:ABC-type phosphate/phosphonate transport system substrate-binding protein